jgi:hypothetical protein
MALAARERGVSLVELAIAAAVMTIALYALTSHSVRNVQRISGLTKVSERLAHGSDVVHGVEQRLRGAVGYRPAAWVVAELVETDATGVAVDSVRGFPPAGSLELAPGTAAAERLAYASLADEPDYRAFEGLRRPGPTHRHAVGTAVRWRSFGEAVPGAAAGTFDAIANSPVGPVPFRGDASGFCFQRWITAGGERRLGAVVGGQPVPDGWSSLWFEPASTLVEADRRADLNRDGDRADVFDLGRLRLRSWSASGYDDIVVSRTAVVQERGRWGVADLDGDGGADPLLLWHDDDAKLQVQLVLWVGAEGGVRQFKKVETAVRLGRGR